MFQEINYINSLKPDDGFELSRIVATTYSLEPGFIYLLSTLFEMDADTFNDDLSTVKSLASFNSKIAQSKAIKEKRLKIFYQYDKFQYNLEKIDDKFAALISQCCIPIKPSTGSFHPKIILAEYENNKKEIKHRLIISSRNLTSSDLLETQVILEKEVTTKIDGDITKCELFNLIRQQGWTLKGKTNKVEAFIQSPNEVNKFYNLMKLDDLSYEKIIVSPFYTQNPTIGNATFYNGDKLHSKLFYITKGNEHNLWIGSANCTFSGLQNSCEAMVKVSFEEDITTELKEWITKTENKLEIYIITNAANTSKKQVNIVEKVIDKCKFSVSCLKNQNNDNYKLTFSVSKPKNISFDNLSVALITRNSDINYKPLSEQVTFSNVPQSKITACLVVKYVDEIQDEEIKRLVMAEMDTGTEELINKNIESLANEPIKSIIPKFDLSSKPSKKAGSTTNLSDDDSSISSKVDDKDYERLMKLYTAGKTDILKSIKGKLENNKEFYEEETKDILLAWLNELLI